MFKRLGLALFLALSGTLAHAAPPPPVPPVPDSNRTQTYNITSPTPSIQVPFNVFGDCTDIAVTYNGIALVLNTDYTCASASGIPITNLPLPITDMVITFATNPTTNLPVVPPTSGQIVISGAWHPRDLVQPTAPGINRREFNQTTSTLVAGMRELYQFQTTYASQQPMFVGMTPTVGAPANPCIFYSNAGTLGCSAVGTGLQIIGNALNLQPAQSTAIGGVKSDTNTAHQWIAYIDSNGLPHQTQPSFADISGTAAPSQIPLFTSSAAGAVPASGGGTTNFLRADGSWDPTAGGGLPSIADGHLIANATGSATTAQDTAPSTWFDHAYCNTVGYIIVRLTGAWTCSNALPINIAWMGADNTGANDISTVFNSAQASCYNQVGARGGTIYIPPGSYKVTNTLQWAPGCSIIADPSAKINLAASVDLLAGTYGNGSGPSGCTTNVYSCVLNKVELQGGVWNCNNETAVTDFYLPYIDASVYIHDIVMTNCTTSGSSYLTTGNSGGTTPVIQDDGLFLERFYMENDSTSNAVNNFGITIQGSGLGDSDFTDGFIQDTYEAFQAINAFSVHITRVHPWTYTLCLNNGFHFISGSVQIFMLQDTVDGPLCSGAAAYSFDAGGPFIVDQLRYDAATENGIPGTGTYAVYVGPSVQLINLGMQLNGNGSVPVTKDYIGTPPTSVTTVGETTSLVTTALPACTALPSNGACNIR